MTDSDERTTAGLIDELVGDLAPVRRFPSLGTGLAFALGAWGIAAGLSTFLHAGPNALFQKASSDLWFVLVVSGLSVAGVAGCAGAISSVLPGREDETRRAGWVAALGLGVAVFVGATANWFGVDPVATSFAKDAGCFMLGATIGIAPLGVLVLLERRGFIQQPARSALIALAGGFALGGLAVQLFCQQSGASHTLLGHISVPVVMAAIATLPLAWLLSPTHR
jgi:hypothetical protein